MKSLFAVVTVFAATMVGSTVAVAQCDQNIIKMLEEKPDCYVDGKPPPSLVSTGGLGTHVRISGGDKPDDDNTKCVTARQYKVEGENVYKSDVWIYLKTGGDPIKYSPRQVQKEGYLEETLDDIPPGAPFVPGAKYRLYVIHNGKGVYSYYRCTEDATGATPGKTMVDIAVACDYANAGPIIDLRDKAMRCFEALGIKKEDIRVIPPCEEECRTT